MEILSITKQTDNKTPSGRLLLNMYKIEFIHNGKRGCWFIASRNSAEALECVKSQPKSDTVSVIPIFIDAQGDESIILNKEFRYTINDYIYSFCSGLVDPGETEIESAMRELSEEIGASENDVAEIHAITDKTFKSEGLTDESAIIYEAFITKLGEQVLQDNEDIKIQIVKIKDLEDFVQNKKLSLMAGLYLPSIYKEFLLRKQIEQLKAEIESLKSNFGNSNDAVQKQPD